MQHDPVLQARIEATYTWLTQFVGQLYGDAEWLITPGDDPIGHVRSIHALRFVLSDYGIPVPPIADPDVDPVGCLVGWRDFLAKLVTVH
jgi:hypothetical protein